MSETDRLRFKITRGWWRFLPFLGLGAAIFAVNSTLDGNYFLRGYVTLLELQVGIVVLYWLIARLGKSKKRLLK